MGLGKEFRRRICNSCLVKHNLHLLLFRWTFHAVKIAFNLKIRHSSQFVWQLLKSNHRVDPFIDHRVGPLWACSKNLVGLGCPVGHPVPAVLSVEHVLVHVQQGVDAGGAWKTTQTCVQVARNCVGLRCRQTPKKFLAVFCIAVIFRPTCGVSYYGKIVKTVVFGIRYSMYFNRKVQNLHLAFHT